MAAESAEAFYLADPAIGWEMVASLKSEVDRLVGCDLGAAARLVERIDQLAGLLGDALSRAFASASQARVLHYVGRHEEANSLYDRAAAAISDAKLSSESAAIKTHQVYALTQMGRYDEALRAADQARQLLKKGDFIGRARLETNVGTVYYRLDRYRTAINHYDRAHSLLSRKGDRAARAFVDFNRSNILVDTDRPREALMLLERAVRAWQDAGLKLLAAQARFHIAYLQFRRGDFNTALTTYHEVRDELEKLGANQLVAWCNQEIAEILLALNSFDEAVESASAARIAFSNLGMPYESAQASLVLGLAAMGLEEHERAREEMVEAREVFVSARNATLAAVVASYLAELALQTGELDEAHAHARSALRVFSRQGLVTRTANLRVIQARVLLERKDLARAAFHTHAALKLIKSHAAPSIEYQCHHLLGRIFRERNKKKETRARFRKAVSVVERMRLGIASDQFKASFLKDKIPVYEDAIASCLDDGTQSRLEEAFRLVESSKSRALAELLVRFVRQPAESTARGPSAALRTRLERLIEDLNWYTSQAGLEDNKGDQRSAVAAEHYRKAIVRSERQIARLFRLLEGQSSSLGDIRMMRSATPSDLMESLSDDETAIEYFTTGDQLSAFVGTGKRISVARNIASRTRIDNVLRSLRFQLEKFNYGPGYVEAYFGQLRRSSGEHLSELYKLVFGPLENLIPSDKLIIIPHAGLHYVPFHALFDGSGYLVDRFEISRAPSAAVLKLCRATRRRKRGGSLVALGVTDRGTPHITNEIDELIGLFPDAIKLTGDKATRENLMAFAPRARFLHLASHGYFRRDNPMFSFLKLAGSRLNFYSLLDLKLNAEMVTLSACHTGVNEVFPGDELHGLMRGFLYAGAPSLVASLWAVSDRSTAHFMREMYGRIRQGASKRAALRQAQLAIKDDYGHPYYWAPFVVMGSPD